jgi:anthranilate/para-aminobenzoate synthase component I
MTTTSIPTDLVTPLGAYLALRSAGGASFLLESVEKGRLGRHSLVGTGSRLVSFDEAEAEVADGRPVVGFLGYDHVARLEPTVPLPEPGPDLPESRFVVAETLVRFDHVKASAEVLAGDRDAVAALLDWPVAPPPGRSTARRARRAASPNGRPTRRPSRRRSARSRRARRSRSSSPSGPSARPPCPRSRSTARSGR